AALLVLALWPVKTSEPEAAGRPEFWLRTGAVAFLLTSLTGHPLLDPRMQILFWGLAGTLGAGRAAAAGAQVRAGESSAGRRRLRRLLAVALAGLVAGSTVASVRIGRKSIGALGLYGMPAPPQPMPLAETLADEPSEVLWWTAQSCRL